MKRTLLSLVLVTALLVPASLAFAVALPKPTDSTLKPPDSIAGVKLGMTEAKVKAAWGAGGECNSSTEIARCSYGDFEGSSGYAFVDFSGGKASSIAIYGGKNSAGDYAPKATGSIAKMKTSGGIGIGSTFAALKKAFPKGKVEGSTSASAYNFSIAGKSGSKFSFGILGDSKKVYAVAMTD